MSRATPKPSFSGTGRWTAVTVDATFRPHILASEIRQLVNRHPVQFRRTPHGFAFRWGRAGVPVLFEVRSRDVYEITTLAEELPAELQQLLLWLAERLKKRRPRGPTAGSVGLLAALRSAARHLRDNVAAELAKPTKGQSSRWFRSLLRRANQNRVALGRNGLPHELPDPVCVAAYAIARFAGVDWKGARLTCPVSEGIIDRTSFTKMYLSPVGSDVDGGLLFVQTLDRLDRKWRKDPAAQALVLEPYSFRDAVEGLLRAIGAAAPGSLTSR